MSEQFVDVQEDPIPPRETWSTLSANQLLDVKTRLETKEIEFRNTPAIAKVLRQSIAEVSALLDAQL